MPLPWQLVQGKTPESGNRLSTNETHARTPHECGISVVRLKRDGRQGFVDENCPKNRLRSSVCGRWPNLKGSLNLEFRISWSKEVCLSVVTELAHLVIREGSKWTDVFRLLPGHSVTIGRAPTNQVVLKDERCSRTHAELFMASGQWTLRDLDSRNGRLSARFASRKTGCSSPATLSASADPSSCLSIT